MKKTKPFCRISLENFENLQKSAQFLQVFIHMSILAILRNRQQGNSFIADSIVLIGPWRFEINWCEDMF